MVPTYEKLLEVVINEQVIEYVEQNNILREFQAVFRKNNSCVVHFKQYGLIGKTLWIIN